MEERWHCHGQVLVKDIVPGSANGPGNPTFLTSVDGALVFLANARSWRSDGTADGTVMVFESLLFPQFFTNVDDKLFFITQGRVLWVVKYFKQLPLQLTDFRAVRRANDINVEFDLGGTGHQALNFTGIARAAGDTWIAVYDPAPNPPPVTFGSVSLRADVLIHTFNNKKGAGLLALYNEAPSKKGLALTLYSAGNTDTLVLATVDQAGKLVTLKTVSLGAGIAENAWYRVSMDVTVDTVS